MAVVITVAQQEGGTGKTTLAANLAAAVASSRRVALLDIDPQKSLGRWHGLRRARLEQAAALAFSDTSGWRLPAELDRQPTAAQYRRARRNSCGRSCRCADPAERARCLGRGGNAAAGRRGTPPRSSDVQPHASRVEAARCDRRRSHRPAASPSALSPRQPGRLRACLRRRSRRHRGCTAFHRSRRAARVAR